MKHFIIMCTKTRNRTLKYYLLEKNCSLSIFINIGNLVLIKLRALSLIW